MKLELSPQELLALETVLDRAFEEDSGAVPRGLVRQILNKVVIARG